MAISRENQNWPTGTAHEVSDVQKTDTTWGRVAELVIETEHTIAFDVCAEHGQMFGNVRETRWLRDNVADDLASTFETPADALQFVESSR